mmetsp:Transcript_32211/g.75642  ORF Transcript_32211/g.75642 Transcript_32211/m.75642 type:complete len:355 (+) Transcript_32211:59-1123(+)
MAVEQSATEVHQGAAAKSHEADALDAHVSAPTSLKAIDQGHQDDVPQDVAEWDRNIPSVKAHVRPKLKQEDLQDLEILAQEVRRASQGRDLDEWSVSSSEAEGIPFYDLVQQVPMSCRVAAVALARASTRSEGDQCDERPVTDWLTTVELHLLPDDLVELAANRQRNKRSKLIEGGSALPFAARYALAESSAHRKRRTKQMPELRSFSRAHPPGPSGPEQGVPCAASHSAEVCDGVVVPANGLSFDSFVAEGDMCDDESFPSLPPVVSGGPLKLPLSTKDAVTCVVDEHKIDLLNEDSGDEDGHGNRRRPKDRLYGCSGCGYWPRVQWLRPFCVNNPGCTSADEVSSLQQLIRL